MKIEPIGLVERPVPERVTEEIAAGVLRMHGFLVGCTALDLLLLRVLLKSALSDVFHHRQSKVAIQLEFGSRHPNLLFLCVLASRQVLKKSVLLRGRSKLIEKL